MGRRKERRLAAINASGRRVKLDLSAEPSGDLGGSSTQEGVGGEGDSKSVAEFPDSPSSSGKQTQNPLLLLGQYSDEELDGDSNEVTNNSIAEDASIGMDEQSNSAATEKAEPAETNIIKDSNEEVEELLLDNAAASKFPSEKPQKESISEIDSSDLLNQTNKMRESTKSAALDDHLVGDTSSGWKMVLHEESNQYYYWNVTTGETSWEVPDVLAQLSGEMSEQKTIRDTAGKMDAVMGTNHGSAPSGMAEDDFTRELSVHPKLSSETNDGVDMGTKEHGSNASCGSDAIKVKEENNQDQGAILFGGHSVGSNNDADFSLQLIKQCENLLERLNSVKGLDCYREDQDPKSKCSLEIEIRLADIKTLSPYESCLLPFWLHSEAQLNRLEADVDRVIQHVHPASQDGYDSSLELHECTGHDAETGSGVTKTPPATLESHGVDNTKSILEANSDGATTISYSSAPPGNDMIKDNEITGTETGSELYPKPALDSLEDVDMDVDMEVEDASSIRSPHAGASGAHHQMSVDQLDVKSTLSNEEAKLPGQVSFPPDEEGIPPPPPDAEPFPPLPPDDEPFPPPPPDEPPETSYPPSGLSSIQPIPYSVGYALPYPGSNLEYYVQPNPEVSVSTYYPISEGGQLPLSHAQQYYEAGPNVYPVAPAIVNHVVPSSYYELQNGTSNPSSLMHSTTESSGAKSEPASGETGAAGSFDSCPEAGFKTLLNHSLNVNKSSQSSAITPPEVAEGQRSPATSSVTNAAPVPSTSDTDTVSSTAATAIAAAAAAAMKSQPKASRTKKRTVAVVSTLRSNKKVSSLVDKWKAAKEELHEEAEEPEDAYEILEKKRQREIEKWRANQIASGEAKDNANFQPLGGDWRERVKRRRAEKMKESGSEDRNEKPDLVQVSKSLPSGWQAYWDDSAKKVYYGNVLTSVTMWTRPTE